MNLVCAFCFSTNIRESETDESNVLWTCCADCGFWTEHPTVSREAEHFERCLNCADTFDCEGESAEHCRAIVESLSAECRKIDLEQSANQ